MSKYQDGLARALKINMKDEKAIIIQVVHLDPSILNYANSSSLEGTSLDHDIKEKEENTSTDALVTEASDVVEPKVTTIVATGRCNTES